MSFAEQFLSALQRLIQNRRKQERFRDATINAICRTFATETEARFVAEKVLSRDEVVRLLVEPATPDRRQKFLNVFEAEVSQSGIALWQDFLPRAEAFIDDTAGIQLEVLGTVGEAATTDILSRKIDNLQSLLDELKEPKTTREEYLARAAAESRASCIARWEAAGVSYELAQELADDMSVGAPSADLRSQFEKPVVWLMGEFGIGKSLLIERLFQEAVADAKRHEDAPVPVFLRARDIAAENCRLINIVDATVPFLKNAKTQRVIIFIDGVDETSHNFADNLKIDIRTIQSIKPEMRVFVTSRPIYSLEDNDLEQNITVPTLESDGQSALISRIAGQDVYVHYFDTYPETLRDAISRPLFAILLGNYWRERSFHTILSTGELLSSLVKSSLRRSLQDIENAIDQLERLAILSVERDGAIQLSEVGSWLNVQPMLNSRLVVERGETVEFSLPILAQWFAAQRLTRDDFPLEQLLDDPQRLERWRYPLMVFISSTSHESASKVLTPIVRKYPSFAATIVRESISDGGSGETLPPLQESGVRIRSMMQAWIDGVGPLAELIAPVDERNKLRALGICVRQNYLTHGWYYGSAEVKNVEIVPELGEWGVHTPGWLLGYGRVEGRQSSWAWQRTLTELTYSLKQLLKRQGLPVESVEGPLWEETIWMLALKCANKYSSSDYKPIKVSKLREWLNIAMGTNGKVTLHNSVDIISLLEILHVLDNQEITEINWPWPKPDKPWGKWIWSPYSDEQLLKRAEAVYSAALLIYQQFAQRWFSKLVLGFDMFAATPGRIVALLEPPHSREEGVGPALNWYIEPFDSQDLPHKFELCDAKLSRDNFWKECYVKRQDKTNLAGLGSINRPRIFSGGIYLLDLYSKTPATNLAYKWLWNDLKKISWLDKYSTL